MAAFQGYTRLNNGLTKNLSKSEVDRGYVFITHDKAAKKQLGKNFSVKVGGRTLTNKNVDSSGRVYIGTEATKCLGQKSLAMKMVGNQIIISA